MSVDLLPLQQYWPLATVAVWWSLAIYQVYRDRFRTWTERFFLAACFFTGAYALADLFFFTAGSPGSAQIAAEMGFSFLSLATTCIFLFAVVFYTRMRRAYLVAFAPAMGAIVLVWTNLVSRIGPLDQALGATGPPWVGYWNLSVFLAWAALCFGFAILAAVFLLRTYLEVADQTKRLRRRMLGILASAVLAVVLGAYTNLARGITGQPTLPLFSTGLLFPGIVSFVTLSPTSTERFSVAVRRWKASRYDIKAAFMIYTDGTLIGAKVRPGEKVIDQDLVGATLDVIQNFMRTSFAFRGSVSEIKLTGDHILLVERGHFAYLTVVLHGETNDQLRRHMRDLLLKFEHENQPVLADWRGMPSEAIGTETLLSSLLEEA